MSDLSTSPAATCVFLLTYLLHSTFAVVVAGTVAHRLRRTANPELRVIMWKMILLLPVATTLAVTVLDLPHFGIQFPIARSSADVRLAVHERVPTASPVVVPVVVAESQSAPDIITNELTRRSSEESAAQLDETFSTTSRSVAPASQSEGAAGWLIVVATWRVGAIVCSIGLNVQMRRLRQLRKQATVVTTPDICNSLSRLKRQLQLGRSLDLLQSADLQGPVTAGIVRPFILIPSDICRDSNTVEQAVGCTSAGTERHLSIAERDALLAHELVHIAQGDALWNLIVQVIARVFFFQPLNWLVGQQLRKEMDFVADSQAAQVLGERTGLAHCLIRLGERLAGLPRATGQIALAAGMASFRSTLGQRVETLLDVNNNLCLLTRWGRVAALTLMVAGAFLAASIVPRAIAQLPDNPLAESTTLTRNEPMKKQLAALTILTGLAVPAAADEPKEKPATTAQAVELKTTPDALPKGINKFNGMLVGRLAAKDIERGTFVLQVDAVSRVWQNSNAQDPQSIVGKTVEVNGVFGKFLDVLVVTRTGETVEFECKHDGDRLKFPGELLRKVAPYRPEDYPKLPEEFRGFQGAVAAEIVKKDPESFELIVKVTKVSDTWKDSTAKQANSIEGKPLMLAGFWNRKEAFHNLKAGDRIELGMKHIGMRSDHLTVAEFVRKAGSGADDVATKREGEGSVEDGLTPGLRGFRGMLVGRLVEKDIERGTFTITVDAVPRVWENNKAPKPKTLIGKNAKAGGVSGKMLDALVVARVGETIEFGALHESGDRMRVGEVLRKVAPVKPGDYPELPDDFRGFKGMVIGKVVKKDDHLLELIVEISDVKNTFDASRAKNAEAIVGRQVMLAGFWQRKDAFQSIGVGDVIECGVDHKQQLSDLLSVIESVTKVDK